MNWANKSVIMLSTFFASQVFSDSINSKGCGVVDLHGRIVNGKKIGRTLMPWIVLVRTYYALRNGRFKEITCGGSIISRQFLLTAAHCINYEHRKPASVAVYYNSTNLYRRPRVLVQKLIGHPRFNMTTVEHDIAILKLPKPLRFDRFVKPVCLPLKRMHLTDQHAITAGWGRTTPNGTTSDDLRYIVTRILPFEKCTNSFHPRKQKDVFTCADVLCTETNGKGACLGDSGGPLTVRSKMNRNVQVGIASFAKGCAEPEHPSVYSRVSAYLPWIRQTVAVAD